jgi:simple sugar transport system ATP-binding protein
MDRARREEEVARLVADFAIATPDPDNAAQTLSGGNQQRVVLAKWLACNLDVLVLSGPTVGVDIGSKHDIHAILRKLAGQGMGILLISDDLPEVIENCSRVLVLKTGKIAAEMVAAQVTEQRILSHMM